MELWITFTLLAVVMQSVRTAGQKQATQYLSVPAATLVRFLYGLPFAGLYFGYFRVFADGQSVPVGGSFFLWCTLAAISQILATLCLVKALQARNFAVATALAKTETLIAALLGSWFFNDALSTTGYVSVVLGVCGVVIASKWRATNIVAIADRSVWYSLGAGLGFALASLWLRAGILSLAMPPLPGAAYALLCMVIIQTILCMLWVACKERHQFKVMRQKWKACMFIGFTSVAGSIGWFTAISMQNAALVRTLGQTEFLVALAITRYYFGEAVSRREYLGMLFVIMSVLLLVQKS